MKKILLFSILSIFLSTCRLPVDMFDDNFIGKWQNFEQCKTIITIEADNSGVYESKGSSHCSYRDEGRARMNNSTLKIGTSKFHIVSPPHYHDTIFNTYSGPPIVSHWEMTLRKSILLGKEVVRVFKIEP
ncbi:MAG: hypothetical protein IT234_06535 [Bacteroidia bacterium]|nr:hypothetical protein [Bacteroidia bacterium]